MEKIKIGYFDRVWYDTKDKCVVGDMAFTFGCAADTRFLASNKETAIKDAVEYLNRAECEKNEELGDGKTTDFAINEVRLADATFDDEEIEDAKRGNRLWCGEIDADTDKAVAVLVCATKEDAEDIIREEYGEEIQAYYITD